MSSKILLLLSFLATISCGHTIEKEAKHFKALEEIRKDSRALLADFEYGGVLVINVKNNSTSFDSYASEVCSLLQRHDIYCTIKIIEAGSPMQLNGKDMHGKTLYQLNCQ
ncbi:hypothetical protein [Flavobacterium gelatinilyticum]|uniref:hypothetical protein n=1 Tax=Flavobacterium gelatinilyticum TaxID=3003260 RepID=UPI002480A21C|nr:hypothetical protein [Flavobacterium gelatinilyticum]